MKVIRFLLFPFALVYDLITTIRNFFYDAGVFKSTSFDIPVIAVGNLSVGGTGKTPQIEFLIRLLKKDKKIAVLSRGYKRKTKGFVLLNDSHSAEDVGDEPLQFFKKFSTVFVAVDAKRVHGIQQLKKTVNPDVILLDDAYQHRKVKAGLYILLTKCDDLYIDDFILPTGNLRESKRGAKRADIIVVTKCSKDLSDSQQEKIRKKLKANSNQQVFFSYIDYHEKTKGAKEIALEAIQDYEIVLITGIANPKPLLGFFEGKNCKVHHLNFPDHHHFSGHDIKEIQAQFEKLSTDKKIMLTTEKDFMRLADRMHGLHYVEIETKFLEDQEKFNQQVLHYCNKDS